MPAASRAVVRKRAFRAVFRSSLGASHHLRCGVLAHGFVRLACKSCRHEKLVAVSCKRRGFCPSCGARRMSEGAAFLVDRVFPLVPSRRP